MIQIRPSRVYLPKFENPPETVLDYLLARFPQVDASTWRDRIARGLVTMSDSTVLQEWSPYRHGMMVLYRKEVPSEPPPLEEPSVIYRDDEILVADKPHGMVVTPSGEHVERSLLFFLQRITGLPDLDPIHRLDRDTAGVVLLTVKRETRALYHRLFAEGLVEREYAARAHTSVPVDKRIWRVANRIEAGEPWFRQRIVEGPVNAVTEIELEDSRPGIGQFRLFPKTGKKHQLRVHMAHIGFPILGDPYYPAMTNKNDGDSPLQLLAKRLAFTDPLTGAAREFVSQRTLALP